MRVAPPRQNLQEPPLHRRNLDRWQPRGSRLREPRLKALDEPGVLSDKEPVGPAIDRRPERVLWGVGHGGRSASSPRSCWPNLRNASDSCPGSALSTRSALSIPAGPANGPSAPVLASELHPGLCSDRDRPVRGGAAVQYTYVYAYMSSGGLAGPTLCLAGTSGRAELVHCRDGSIDRRLERRVDREAGATLAPGPRYRPKDSPVGLRRRIGRRTPIRGQLRRQDY